MRNELHQSACCLDCHPAAPSNWDKVSLGSQYIAKQLIPFAGSRPRLKMDYVRLDPQLACRCSRDPRVIGLESTKSYHFAHAASLGIRHEVLEVPRFVPSHCRSNSIVALAPQRYAKSLA
jgi:hypothetical protein